MARGEDLNGSRADDRRWAAAALVPSFVLSVAVAVASVGRPVLAKETGRIVGRVTLASSLAKRRARFALYPDPQRAGAAERPWTVADEMGNAVVYVESVPADAAPARPREPATVVRQENLTFVPHVTAVVRGESVAFENADPLFHNVFSLSKVATFDLGRYPSGKSKSVRFEERGVAKVFCHIHADMSAVVLVLDNPFFATPDREGRFALDPLPPGEYRVTAWHERAKPVTRTVRVEADREASLDFDVPLEDEERRGD